MDQPWQPGQRVRHQPTAKEAAGGCLQAIFLSGAMGALGGMCLGTFLGMATTFMNKGTFKEAIRNSGKFALRSGGALGKKFK